VAILTTAIGYTLALANLLVILFLVLLQNLLGNHRLFDPVLKFICRMILLEFGIAVRVRGWSNLRTERACVYVANHVNILDPVVLYGFIPRFARAVELEDHFSWPIWGNITTRAGNIPISHRQTSRAVQSLDMAARLIREGTSIIILPEGHRTRDGRLGPFMRGPFRLAHTIGADIVPITMNGAFERKSVHSPVVSPGRLDLVVGPAITYDVYAGSTERELRDMVRGMMADQLER